MLYPNIISINFSIEFPSFPGNESDDLHFLGRVLFVRERNRQ
jgi:hypothetical protein